MGGDSSDDREQRTMLIGLLVLAAVAVVAIGLAIFFGLRVAGV